MVHAYYNRTTSKVLPTPLHDAYKYAKISRKPDIYMCTRTSHSSYLPRQDKFLCCVIATHLFIASLNFSTCCMHGLLTGSKQCHEPCLCVDPFLDLAWE